jgi:hypothetical protein
MILRLQSIMRISDTQASYRPNPQKIQQVRLAAVRLIEFRHQHDICPF